MDRDLARELEISLRLLLDKSSLDKNQSDSISVIEQSGNTLLTIIDDILDISKIETKLPNSFAADSTATIQLVKNNLTELTYLSKSDTDQFAVFSEIFYIRKMFCYGFFSCTIENYRSRVGFYS